MDYNPSDVEKNIDELYEKLDIQCDNLVVTDNEVYFKKDKGDGEEEVEALNALFGGGPSQDDGRDASKDVARVDASNPDFDKVIIDNPQQFIKAIEERIERDNLGNSEKNTTNLSSFTGDTSTRPITQISESFDKPFEDSAKQLQDDLDILKPPRPGK